MEIKSTLAVKKKQTKVDNYGAAPIHAHKKEFDKKINSKDVVWAISINSETGSILNSINIETVDIAQCNHSNKAVFIYSLDNRNYGLRDRTFSLTQAIERYEKIKNILDWGYIIIEESGLVVKKLVSRILH